MEKCEIAPFDGLYRLLQGLYMSKKGGMCYEKNKENNNKAKMVNRWHFDESDIPR